MQWAEYVARLMGDDTQMAAQARTGIDQTTIGRWLRGRTTPGRPADVAQFAQAYGGNVLEAFVVAGFLTAEEAGVPPTPQLDFYSLVDADPDLSEESKLHIKNQYGLLKKASIATRTLTLREEILHNPNLDEATKRQLLKTLDGRSDEGDRPDESSSGKGSAQSA